VRVCSWRLTTAAAGTRGGGNDVGAKWGRPSTRVGGSSAGARARKRKHSGRTHSRFCQHRRARGQGAQLVLFCGVSRHEKRCGCHSSRIWRRMRWCLSVTKRRRRRMRTDWRVLATGSGRSRRYIWTEGPGRGMSASWRGELVSSHVRSQARTSRAPLIRSRVPRPTFPTNVSGPHERPKLILNGGVQRAIGHYAIARYAIVKGEGHNSVLATLSNECVAVCRKADGPCEESGDVDAADAKLPRTVCRGPSNHRTGQDLARGKRK